MTQRIYLDYNATAPLLPAVREKMLEIDGVALNPSSVHFYGRMARKLVEGSRKTLADALSVWPNEIIFTASGTESNNLALRGAGDFALLLSATEHSSVRVTGAALGAQSIPVLENGLLNMAALQAQLQLCNKRPLVSVMLANNETGVIQPISEIAQLVHKHGGILHCDAVQALGKLPVDFGALGVDMLSLAAHKIGGPIGAGALVVRNDLALSPILTGGGQELKRRAGTENVPAIAGFGWAVQAMPDLHHQLGWREQLEKALLAASPESVVPGAGAPRLPNTLCITMPGVNSETQLMNFDLAGICVSAGSACSSGAHRIFPCAAGNGHSPGAKQLCAAH